MMQRLSIVVVFICAFSPDVNVIANAEEVLEDGQEVRLGRRVFDGVLDELEALVDVVQLEPDVVEPLSELVEVGLAVLVEDLQLRLEVLRRVLLESLFLFIEKTKCHWRYKNNQRIKYYFFNFYSNRISKLIYKNILTTQTKLLVNDVLTT